MADEDRKERIAKLLNGAKPKKARGGISFNGNHNIFVGGDLTIGSRARTKEKTRERGWRDEAMIAIRARALELRLTEDQVTALATSLLKKSVPSLDALTAAELGRVFDSMHNMRRPALD